MKITDCIQFANANPLCYLATNESDQPHVRALRFWFADESGFYFQTGGMKDLYKQLVKNPKVEACFYHHEGTIGTMLRISGEVEFLNDRQLKERVMHERPFLKNFGLTADSPGLIIFRIAHGRAHFWTMENNLKPKEYIIF
ncbi:MAG: pyridoxamine 5'-phosphate oxidase family protein [Bacteroidales bacterium]|nr:pyridoxamine 5'-phosphate oxidase family protein [Bacteroidales bacterium]